MTEPDQNWTLNYFNFFTEVEEQFQRSRGTGLFLLSPLDWALIESWKDAGIPLEAVLRGIEEAFKRSKPRQPRYRQINSLAYCAQAVMEEAQAMAGATPSRAARPAAPPFSLDELREHLSAAAGRLSALEAPGYAEIAAALEKLAGCAEEHYEDLESLEQRLTALEDKMLSIARAARTDEELFAARQELNQQLRPYRGKMTAEQLAMLEKQYLDRHLVEHAGLPRLSLFYLR